MLDSDNRFSSCFFPKTEKWYSMHKTINLVSAPPQPWLYFFPPSVPWLCGNFFPFIFSKEKSDLSQYSRQWIFFSYVFKNRRVFFSPFFFNIIIVCTIINLKPISKSIRTIHSANNLIMF